MARIGLIKRSKHLKDYLLVMQEHALLGEEDACSYLLLARRGSEAARRALIEGCLPLVLRWANSLRGKAMSFSHLIEAGNQALFKAIEEADPAQGPVLEQFRLRVEEAVSKARAASQN